MNVDDATATTMADILGCLRSSFPHTYLGLPLSPQKLRVSDFQPLLTSFDRYLAGWKARLLSAGGRIVLVNAVLGSLPIYYMSSTLVPKTVRDLLDAKRRAFFWTGEEKCSGANCLVAWERVCQSRSAGGLGIKNMEDVNHCLLLKFVHKLHEDEPLPWKRWFISHAGDDFGGDPDSYLSKLVLTELPRYRSLTKVQLGSGVRVSFWHDKWLLDDSLAERFPILYSHTVSDAATVQAVMGSGLRQQLRPRLTHAAAAEFLALTGHLSQVTLRDRPDTRFLDVQGLVPFSTRNAYHVLHTPATVSDIARVWDARLPTKVKFFAWLLHHGRLNTRAHLFHRNIKTREESWCEQCPGILETDVHIFLGCSKARVVWHKLQFVVQENTLRQPWNFEFTPHLPETIRSDVMMLTLWHVWKARNAMIFEHQNLSPEDILRRIVNDMDAWSCRYRRLRSDLNVWREWIVNCLPSPSSPSSHPLVTPSTSDC